MADDRRGTVDSFQWRVDGEEMPNEEVSDDPITFLSKFEIKIFECLNTLRTAPAAFADRMMEFRKYYDGNVLRIPNEPIVKTKEGTEAFDEAVNRLRNLEGTLCPFKLSRGLILACQDHVADHWTDEENRIGHKGTDGSTSQTRSRRYGNWGAQIGECLAYGDKDPFRAIMSLLIDDGMQTRSHREHILNEQYTVVGISSGAQKTQGIVIVTLMADKYEEDDEKFEERDLTIAKAYKAASKRQFYSKNQTVTKTKVTRERLPTDKKKGGCCLI